MLHTTLASPECHIGRLCSRHTYTEILNHLREADVDKDMIKHLHALIRVETCGRFAGEIAVSIPTEIIAVGNDKKFGI